MENGGPGPDLESLCRRLCLRRSGRGLRKGAKHDPIQMEWRHQDRGHWPELGQARQVHGDCELYAGRWGRLLRLRSDQEEGRHRIEFPRARVEPQDAAKARTASDDFTAATIGNPSAGPI